VIDDVRTASVVAEVMFAALGDVVAVALLMYVLSTLTVPGHDAKDASE
jgi:hypothetical protein